MAHNENLAVSAIQNSNSANAEVGQDDVTQAGLIWRRARSTKIYENYGKRGLDLFLAAVTIPLIVPVLLALFLIVRRDGGPFLFRHTRIGRDAKPFGCLKIRTMGIDSEKRLAEIIEADPERAREWRMNFKFQDDPRVTKIGRLLRATSLDELPQLFNVLKGEMSFVGPRPITADEITLYGEHSSTYHRVRPGLTGPWQISGRRGNNQEDRVRQDIEYSGRISLLRDLYFIVATVPEMVFFRGR